MRIVHYKSVAVKLVIHAMLAKSGGFHPHADFDTLYDEARGHFVRPIATFGRPAERCTAIPANQQHSTWGTLRPRNRAESARQAAPGRTFAIARHKAAFTASRRQTRAFRQSRHNPHIFHKVPTSAFR
jgi:hypothetical protein